MAVTKAQSNRVGGRELERKKERKGVSKRERVRERERERILRLSI